MGPETFRDHLLLASSNQPNFSPESQDIFNRLDQIREDYRFHSYSTFQELKTFPTNLQSEFLAQMYESSGFPNGSEFGRALSRVNNIKVFSPTEELSEDFIRETMSKLWKGLGIGFHGIDVVKDFVEAEKEGRSLAKGQFRDAKESMKKVAELLLQNNNRADVSSHIGIVAIDTWPDFDTDIVPGYKSYLHYHIPYEFLSDVEGYLSWTAAQDLVALENPFEPFIDIWEKGGWFLGMVNGTEGRLGIYLPEVKSPLQQQATSIA